MRTFNLLNAVFFALCSIASAADPKPITALSDFMRVTKQEGKRQPVSFDTAIVKFADEKKKIEVDLIAAVHIGDKKYYEELNEIFKQYDAVLFELVAESGTKPGKEMLDSRKNKSVLSSFQSGIGEALALDFQLAHIDYTAENMVHADLSPEDFVNRVADRGDVVQMMYRGIILGMKKSGEKETSGEYKKNGRLVGAAFSSNPALSLKRFFAQEMLNEMDDSVWVLGGDEGSAIISDRNAAALKVLRKEIEEGKKKIAIFYGGAHLAEFAKSLKKDFKMKHQETTWIIAWDLTKDHSARNKPQETRQKNLQEEPQK